MGRRFPGGGSGGGSGGGGGGGVGPRNTTEMFAAHGTFNWTLPSDFDSSVSMVVRCWGAGGSCGNSATAGNGYGGGGGGLALGEISTLSAGDTLTIVIGQGARANNGVGGSSSLADSAGNVFMSASGGNSGFNNVANQGSSTMYGVGGIGVDGTVTCSNWRGGRGGQGSLQSLSGYGGGGGSAPHPDAFMNGKAGGDAPTSYTGASGASINFPGGVPYTGSCSVGGAGTAGEGTSSLAWGVNYGYGGQGGAGILGAGGVGGTANSYSNAGVTSDNAGDGKGHAIWGPNNILLGGGGGGGNAASMQTSDRGAANAGCGGPGAGGGAASSHGSGVFYMQAGNGGVLGGGGGAAADCTPGSGGNAGGGGGCGYNANQTASVNQGWGGDGLVFIQYKITF